MTTAGTWEGMPLERRLALLQAAWRVFDTMGRYAAAVADGKRPEGPPPGLWAWDGQPPATWRCCLYGAEARNLRTVGDAMDDARGNPIHRADALADFPEIQDRFREIMQAAEGMQTIPPALRRRAVEIVGNCSYGFGAAHAAVHAEIDLEAVRARGAADAAKARSELAEERGTQADARAWRRKWKVEKRRTERMEIARLVGMEHRSLQDAADELHLSLPTASRRYAEARKMLPMLHLRKLHRFETADIWTHGKAVDGAAAAAALDADGDDALTDARARVDRLERQQGATWGKRATGRAGSDFRKMKGQGKKAERARTRKQ